jgi:hypothetical protein
LGTADTNPNAVLNTWFLEVANENALLGKLLSDGFGGTAENAAEDKVSLGRIWLEPGNGG